MFDRAFLIYMSQVVSRGESLYHSTPFGYTPLSTLIVGYLMRLGQLLGIGTIEVARITGILCWGFCAGGMFLLGKEIFRDKLSPFMVALLFCGVAFIPILAGVNAEPKLWVLLSGIFGMIFCIREDWFLSGLFFSIGAMSWHVAVIGVVATGIYILIQSDGMRSSWRFSRGIFAGLIPVLLYLWATNSWIEFWDQAIVRKVIVEGERLGESPLEWLKVGGIAFLSDIFHLLFGFVGFVWLFYLRLTNKQRISDRITSLKVLDYLFIYILLWTSFNLFEFQGALDLIPLTPLIVIFAVYFIGGIKLEKRNSTLLLWLLLVFYNFFDAIFYDIPYTYDEELSTVQHIEKTYGDPFVIGFEAYYTLLEKPMPTKFMRYWAYEDYLINKAPGGCERIKEQLESGPISHIIEFDHHYREFSSAYLQLKKRLGYKLENQDRWKKNNTSDKWISDKNGECGRDLIADLTSEKPVDHFNIRRQIFPIGGSFFVRMNLSIYEIQDRK